VSAGENVLAVALAAGITLPHSCRQGRCASCRARLVSGDIAYPDGILPPGLSAGEAAAGAVLLCQARPRSDLVVETRRVAPSALPGASVEILTIESLPFDALRLQLRLLSGSVGARPGQFVDAVNAAGLVARLPVIALRADDIELEAASDGSAFREWLATPSAPGSALRLSGPFDAPR
jgi:CDP-4-dehydro-6-deoxyglucose reductase, E3